MLEEVARAWEKLLGNTRLKELAYHRFLENHAGLFFSDPRTYIVISNLEMGADLKPDLVVVSDNQSYGFRYELIELESPHDQPFTPNVFKHRRPDWLGPFNFFLFPMLSETFGGYPAGFDKSNFVFITPYESDRRKWSSLQGVNVVDGESYQIAMQPTLNQDKVIPESFRIVLRKYLVKPETKSLAPDGTPCTGTTHGLLQRARITAGKLVPVGKETDRRWEQGEDPSMIDSDIYVFEKRTKLVIAEPSERKKWAAIGLRRLKRESNLSLTPVSNAIKGKPVRPRTLSIIRQTAGRLVTES
jgi:hypothetical protein